MTSQHSTGRPTIPTTPPKTHDSKRLCASSRLGWGDIWQWFLTKRHLPCAFLDTENSQSKLNRNIGRGIGNRQYHVKIGQDNINLKLEIKIISINLFVLLTSNVFTAGLLWTNWNYSRWRQRHLSQQRPAGTAHYKGKTARNVSIDTSVVCSNG